MRGRGLAGAFIPGVGVPGAAGIIGTTEGLASGIEGRSAGESIGRGATAVAASLALGDLGGRLLGPAGNFARRALPGARKALSVALHPARTINNGIGRAIGTAFPGIAQSAAKFAPRATAAGIAGAAAMVADQVGGITQVDPDDSPFVEGVKNTARKAISYSQLLNPGLTAAYYGANSLLGSLFSPMLEDAAARYVDADKVKGALDYVSGIDPDAAKALGTAITASTALPAVGLAVSDLNPSSKKRSAISAGDVYDILRTYDPSTFPEFDRQLAYDTATKGLEAASGHIYNYMTGLDDAVSRNVGQFAATHPKYFTRALQRFLDKDYSKPVFGGTPFFIDPIVKGLKRGIETSAVDYAKDNAGWLDPEMLARVKQVVEPAVAVANLAGAANKASKFAKDRTGGDDTQQP